MKQGMLRCGLVISLGLAAAGCWWNGSNQRPTTKVAAVNDATSLAAVQSARIDRGKYLVTITSCGDCHTPFKMTERGPVPDQSRMLSGHPAGFEVGKAPDLGKGPWVWAGVGTNTAFAGPWGITYAINLTPDKVSGLGGGGWDEARFIKAMRTGKHFGEARPILPPMPWQGLSQATDEDLKSIWAYLQTVPAVKNEVPSAVVNPPPGAPR